MKSNNTPKPEQKIAKYQYDHLLKDIYILGQRIRSHYIASAQKLDAIVAIPRGGLVPATYLANELQIKRIEVSTQLRPMSNIIEMSGNKGIFNILIVDDISDSGHTLQNYIKDITTAHSKAGIKSVIRTATLLMRPGTVEVPNFYAREIQDRSWIQFPWEVDVQDIAQGHFIEWVSNHWTGASPEFIHVDSEGVITLVTHPELATVYNTPEEAYRAIEEVQQSPEFEPLSNLGQLMMSVNIYNKLLYAEHR